MRLCEDFMRSALEKFESVVRYFGVIWDLDSLEGGAGMGWIPGILPRGFIDAIC